MGFNRGQIKYISMAIINNKYGKIRSNPIKSNLTDKDCKIW